MPMFMKIFYLLVSLDERKDKEDVLIGLSTLTMNMNSLIKPCFWNVTGWTGWFETKNSALEAYQAKQVQSLYCNTVIVLVLYKQVMGVSKKFYINLIFSLVTPPCKAVPPGAWLGRLLELSSFSQTIQSHALTKMPEARLDQTIHC